MVDQKLRSKNQKYATVFFRMFAEVRDSLIGSPHQIGLLLLSYICMGAVVFFLLGGLLFSVFGFEPIHSFSVYLAIFMVSFCGMACSYYLNLAVFSDVTEHTRLTEVLVNSLGQGFLSFGPDGVCDEVFSQSCRDLLETSPSGKNIMDVLRIPEEGREDFKGWLEIMFLPDHALSFPDVINFLPQFFPHSKKRRITLVYKSICDGDGSLFRVVLIATDITDEYEAQVIAKERQEFADMICRIFRERNQFLATITQVRAFLEQSAAPVTRDTSASILRLLHTLKASVKHFHLKDMADLMHNLESELRSDDAASDAQFRALLDSGRTHIDRELNRILETLHDLIGQDYERRGNTREIEESALYNFGLVMSVSGVSSDIVDHYLRFIVALPIQDCFRQFERELIDLAEVTGKQLKSVRYSGSNPPILLREYQSMIFSLTHICRNILDHGIEPTVTRLSRGKDPAGQVSVEADVFEDGDQKKWMKIVIADDGDGIDPERVRGKLAILNPDANWAEIDDHEVIQHIFTFGVSTRENVTDLSGRGVGLNVVKREVENLNGTIEVFSEACKGTRFEIIVPYLMAI